MGRTEIKVILAKPLFMIFARETWFKFESCSYLRPGDLGTSTPQQEVDTKYTLWVFAKTISRTLKQSDRTHASRIAIQLMLSSYSLWSQEDIIFRGSKMRHCEWSCRGSSKEHSEGKRFHFDGELRPGERVCSCNASFGRLIECFWGVPIHTVSLPMSCLSPMSKEMSKLWWTT